MKNRYPQHSLTAKLLHRLALTEWLPAIKLSFTPFFLAFLCNILLAISSHFITTVTELYALRTLSVFVVFYFVMMAFYVVHSYWQGDELSLVEQAKEYSMRFVPALFAFIIIFSATLLLMVAGVFIMRLVAPYAHYLGNLAPLVLVSMIGLLGAFWVMACFYWPFFIVRDQERMPFAMKRSFAIAGLTKSMMVYLPAVAFILLFLLTDYQMKWMQILPWPWLNLIISFVLKWVLGAWVLTMTCIMMNESTFLIQRAEVESKKKSEK